MGSGCSVPAVSSMRDQTEYPVVTTVFVRRPNGLCVITSKCTCLSGGDPYGRENADIKGVTVFSTVTANLIKTKVFVKVDPAGRIDLRGCARRQKPFSNSWCVGGNPKPKRHKMKLSIRTNQSNPDHHLWNNHGRWYIHYVVHPTPFTKERVRRPLGTDSIREARRLRDAFLARSTNLEGGVA